MTKLRGGILGISLLLLLVAGAAAPVEATPRPLRHVRIVLDISKSMLKNDPDRLATLSTVLLQDLVDPNPSLGDSFEVIPFDPKMSWNTGPPPTTLGTRIRFEQGRRDAFADALRKLPYDGKSTYFYPGLNAALEDLEKTPSGATDIKTVILVTDGVPLQDKRDAEAKLIADLQPRMVKAGIRFYILAFGSEAKANEGYLSGLVTTPTGPLGVAIVDPDGRELLGSMLKIFARSFGYSPDAPQTLPGQRALDLEAHTTPEKVAVVVVARRPAPLPRLALTPPSGGHLNRQGDLRAAAEKGASYSLLWVLEPSAGNYGFESDANPGSVAVLRPIRLSLEILPAPPHTQTGRTMATTPFPLRVLVRNPTGATGAPGPVDLAFRPLGERRSTGGFTWQGDWSAPPAGDGTAIPEGRVYDIAPEFPAHREEPLQVYTGHLEVRAKSGEAEVGALKDDHAHPIEVHPLLAIAPAPLAAYVSERALGRHEERCTRLSLTLAAGKLPHPERPEYPVQALLEGDPALLGGELHQATYRLDGLTLEPAAHPAAKSTATTGEWRRGRTLTAAALLGPHEVCVRVGRPTAGDPGKVLELQVAFTLREDPYDDFHAIAPFLLKVLIEPPGFVDRWRPYLWGGFALLALLAALWYLRDRPVLPPDLRCLVGREGGAAPTDALGERTFASRALGFADERPVVAPGEDRLLGRVQAADAELFRFRLRRGTTVEATGGERLATVSGAAVLAVHRNYRLRTPDGVYTLRLEYR